MPKIIDASEIFDLVSNKDYLGLLSKLQQIEKYSLEEDAENNLGTSILELALSAPDSDYAEALIEKIKAPSFQKGLHFDALHSITNNRTNAISILEAMIEAGFDINDVRETKNHRGQIVQKTDVFNEIVKQTGAIGSKNYDFDLALIITLLETKKVAGFKEDLAQPLIDDLLSRKVSLASLRDREALAYPSASENLILGINTTNAALDITATNDSDEKPNASPHLFIESNTSNEKPVVVRESHNFFRRFICYPLSKYSR